MNNYIIKNVFKFYFSDLYDKILMLVGILSGMLAAVCFPLIFLLYGQIVGTLVNYENSVLTNSK